MPRYEPSEVMRPGTLQEAVSILKEYGPAARVVAGNTTLYELSKQGGLAGVERLVDLNRVGLDYLRLDESGDLHVGACTTFSELTVSPFTSKQPFKVLRQVATKITPPQIRNMGTVGGSACSGLPFYDMPVVLLALGAKMKVAGSGGERLVDSDDFFVDYFVTALSPEEILVEVQIPGGDSSAAFAKLGRTSVDFAVVNAAARISLDQKSSSIARSRVAVGAVGTTPMRLKKVEEELAGNRPSEDLLARVAAVPIDFEPSPSVHASSNYKRRVIPAVVKDVLRSAFQGLSGWSR